MSEIITLDELVKRTEGGIVRNDRGNGFAGPAWLGETILSELDESDLGEPLTLVSEQDDPEAWQLARVAFDSFELDGAPRLVGVGARDHGQNGYQAIYAI